MEHPPPVDESWQAEARLIIGSNRRSRQELDVIESNADPCDARLTRVDVNGYLFPNATRLFRVFGGKLPM